MPGEPNAQPGGSAVCPALVGEETDPGMVVEVVARARSQPGCLVVACGRVFQAARSGWGVVAG